MVYMRAGPAKALFGKVQWEVMRAYSEAVAALIKGVSNGHFGAENRTLQSKAKVQPKKKGQPRSSREGLAYQYRITGFTHIPKLSSQRFHLGEERNCRPLRSLEDFVVGQGSAEPWAHMDEGSGLRGGGWQGEKNQELGEMLRKELCRVALSH